MWAVTSGTAAGGSGDDVDHPVLVCKGLVPADFTVVSVPPISSPQDVVVLAPDPADMPPGVLTGVGSGLGFNGSGFGVSDGVRLVPITVAILGVGPLPGFGDTGVGGNVFVVGATMPAKGSIEWFGAITAPMAPPNRVSFKSGGGFVTARCVLPPVVW